MISRAAGCNLDTAPIRFVIFSAARSGTSLLADTLNTHPEVVCHGEIFHPDPEWHIRGNMAGWTKEAKLNLRIDSQELLKNVFHQPGTVATGFKMWRNQESNVCDQLLEDIEVRTIIFERCNKLSQYSSDLLARQTGIWNLSKKDGSQRIRSTPVPFDESKFMSFLDYQRETFSSYRQLARGMVLDISFHNLLRDGFGEILQFLDVPPMFLEAQKRRLHGTDILGRFRQEDHDPIRKVLERIRHPEWEME